MVKSLAISIKQIYFIKIYVCHLVYKHLKMKIMFFFLKYSIKYYWNRYNCI